MPPPAFPNPLRLKLTVPVCESTLYRKKTSKHCYLLDKSSPYIFWSHTIVWCVIIMKKKEPQSADCIRKVSNFEYLTHSEPPSDWNKCLYFCQFASRISGMRFCEASAKDNFNVDEIFLKLVDDILSKVSGAVLLQFQQILCSSKCSFWNIWLKIASFSLSENVASSWVFLAQFISSWDKRSFQDLRRHAETKSDYLLKVWPKYNGK